LRSAHTLARRSQWHATTLLERSLPDEADTRRRRAAEAIEAYLARHPLAADTEQGIAQWWLGPMGVNVPLADVQQALEALLRKGRVERVVLPDGSAIYRAPRP
jgi:LmbE family N-acetylglucosaminyl deacetylase